ncbi:MAG: hypothetical protein NC310_01450 [Roseburia sp.]|nr:hypothetical protein [Anaeroplasma bactoclasticum]MCM1195719.1 hypothetical protein [Roseburia sp.]MCM1556069.1 hypothetical protein [Anaeroplasma bactoclasticum]
MKKIIFLLCFMFLLLTSCKDNSIDSIYKEFINSDYFKEKLTVTVDNKTEKIGTLEIGDNSFLLQIANSAQFLYFKAKNTTLNFYMNQKFTMIDIPFTDSSTSDLPILIKEKKKTEFGFTITYEFKKTEGIEEFLDDTTFDIDFYLTKKRITQIKFVLPEVIEKLIGYQVTILLQNIEYGAMKEFAPNVSSYEFLDNNTFINHCLATFFPGTFPSTTEYELDIFGGNIITTKVNEEPIVTGYLKPDINVHKIYKLTLTIEDDIDYSIPGEYNTYASVVFEGFKYTTSVCIRVVEPNYELSLWETLTVPINGPLDFPCNLYDSNLGFIPLEASNLTYSDNFDITKEGVYTVIVSTEYEGKTYSKECVIEVKDPKYEIKLINEYDLIFKQNSNINLDDIDVILKASNPYFRDYYLKANIVGYVDVSCIGEYPVTLSVTVNDQTYTKDFTVQIINSQIDLQDTIEIESDIVDVFRIDDYLLLATSTSLYKYDIHTNQVVGKIDLLCQFNHYYYKDSYLYVTANYPYTSEYLENDEYSGTVNKISFDDFSLVSQVEVNFFPYSIFVDKRNQAIITMGLNQHVDLISLDFETKVWEKIDSIYMKSEIYYSHQEDAFILISTQTTEDPRYYVWNKAKESFVFKSYIYSNEGNCSFEKGQYINDACVIFFKSDSIWDYTFHDSVENKNLTLNAYTQAEHDYIEGNILYRSYLPYGTGTIYLVKYNLESNLFTYKQINSNTTEGKFEFYENMIYLLNNTTGKIEVYKYTD